MAERLDKKAFIGGEWVESESGNRAEVRCPGDGSVLGTVPECTRKDAQTAVEAAIEGQKALAGLSMVGRIGMLKKALEISSRRAEEAARLLCLESGKTITESRNEAGAHGFSWDNIRIAAENVRSYRGLTLPNNTEDSNAKRLFVNKQPIGVVANISTFTYPSEMPNCTVPYALALGNSVIVKPSRGSPFSSLLLGEILDEAGFPRGSINIVPGPGEEVGEELVANPGTNAVNFFGQLETGKTITQRAGLKKLLFAIVSNNPLVVMDDANLDAAVQAATDGCFPLAGQSPISTRRILVHKDIHDAFVAKFVERVKSLKLSEPLDEAADVGPVHNDTVLNTALEHLEDARNKGGRFLVGGSHRGLYVEPTVIHEATKEMLVIQGPTPGPIAPILTFGSIEEAVELANGTQYGFQAGAFTSSLKNAFYLGENIKAGSVYINEATNCWDEMAPFGGVKNSGMGRMLSDWILDQLSEPKMILFDLAKVAP